MAPNSTPDPRAQYSERPRIDADLPNGNAAASGLLQTRILQQVSHRLLRVRGSGETEQVILGTVQDLFSVRWAACYRGEGEVVTRCRVARTEEADEIAEVLPRELTELLGDDQTGSPVLCPEYVARLHFSPPPELLAPVDLGSGQRAFLLLGPRRTGETFEVEDLEMMRQLAGFCGVALQNAELLDRLRAQVFVDFLTGCYNRRGFEEHIRVEVVRSRRYERPLSLLLLDIDDFKWINDRHGHHAGDHALQGLGRLLAGAFRTTDRVCRFGGDEFAVIFPETHREEVARIAERLRLEIAQLFPDELLPSPISASFGVAGLPEDALDPDLLVRAADRALYRAKAEGRNQVRMA